MRDEGNRAHLSKRPSRVERGETKQCLFAEVTIELYPSFGCPHLEMPEPGLAVAHPKVVALLKHRQHLSIKIPQEPTKYSGGLGGNASSKVT